MTFDQMMSMLKKGKNDLTHEQVLEIGMFVHEIASKGGAATSDTLSASKVAGFLRPNPHPTEIAFLFGVGIGLELAKSKTDEDS